MIRRLWWRSAVLMVLLGYVLALRELLLLAGLLATVYAVAYALSHESLEAVRYTRTLHPRRAFAGEPISCTVRVENRRRLPLVWLTTADRWPNAVVPEASRDLAPSHLPDHSELTLTLSLRGRSQVHREYTLSTRRRGIFDLGPAEARSTDPFALFLEAGSVAPPHRLVVYPRRRALPPTGFASDDPFGWRRAQRRLFEDPNLPMGIRPYASGDSFRNIHWPATARTGELQTRAYQPVAGLDIVVCLNAATYDRHWEGYDPERMEALVETSATLVTEALEAGHRVRPDQQRFDRQVRAPIPHPAVALAGPPQPAAGMPGGSYADRQGPLCCLPAVGSAVALVRIDDDRRDRADAALDP